MELTTKQIQEIESFLDQKGFQYEDLRMEILDHMMSDIEFKISKGFSFESAFVMAKMRWKKHLRKKTSFYFGIYYANFSIVLHKAVKLFKPFFFMYLASYFLPLVLIKYTNPVFSKAMVNTGNIMLQSLAILGTLYVLFLFLRIRQIKYKTTYSFVLQTQLLGGFIFLPVTAIFAGILKPTGVLSSTFTSFFIAGLSIVFICHYFYKKHVNELKKLRLL